MYRCPPTTRPSMHTDLYFGDSDLKPFHTALLPSVRQSTIRKLLLPLPRVLQRHVPMHVFLQRHHPRRRRKLPPHRLHQNPHLPRFRILSGQPRSRDPARSSSAPPPKSPASARTPPSPPKRAHPLQSLPDPHAPPPPTPHSLLPTPTPYSLVFEPSPIRPQAPAPDSR